MSNLKIIIPLVIIFILAISGVYYLYKTQTAIETINTDNESQTASFPQASPTSSPTASGQINGVATQPTTGNDNLTILGEGIAVITPKPNQVIKSPLSVSGTANVTTQTVIIEVLDAQNNIIGSGMAQACVGLDACSFRASVVFTAAHTKTGTVKMYSPSQIDNTPTYEQNIPVTFN